MKRVILILIASFFCFCAVSPSFARTGAEKDYTFADGLRKRGLYRLAAREYVNFLRNYPEHEWVEFAYYYLGLSYKESEDEEEAIKAWEDLQEKFENSKLAEKVLFQMAEMYLDRGTALLEMSEEKEDRALKLKAFENFKKSAKAYNNYQDKAKDSATESEVLTALFNIGYCYESVEAYSRAIEVYEKLVRDYSDFEAQFKIGNVYYEWATKTMDMNSRKRNYEKALDGFRKTLFFGETEFYDDAKIGYANVLIDTGKRKEAREVLINEVRKGSFEKIYKEFFRNPNQVDTRYLNYLAPRAYYIIAECYEIENNFDEANKWLDLIVKNFAKSEFKGAAQKKITEILETAGKSVDAASAQGARRVLDIVKNYNDTAQYSKALDDLYKIRREFAALRDSEIYKEFLYNLAYAYYSNESYLEAGVVAEYLGRKAGPRDKMNGNKPLMGEALYYAGSSYWQYTSGLKDERIKARFQRLAIKQFERLARLAPTHMRAAEVQLHSAGYYLDTKNYDRAALNYTGFLSKLKDTKDDSYTEALFNLAYCYLMAERYDMAESEYKRYVNLYDKKEPKVVVALDLLGACYMRQEEYSEGVDVFKRLDPAGFEWVGDDKLESEYKSIFEDSYYHMGFCYYKMEDFEKAITKFAYFTENFAENPKVPQTRLLLAQLYFDRNDHENVVVVLGDFISRHRDSPDAYKGYILLTESYLKTGKVGEALAAELEMFSIFGKEELPEGAYGKVARIMKDAGQIEGAKSAYQELITDYQDEPNVLERALWFSAEYAFETDDLAFAANRYKEYLKVATDNVRKKKKNPNAVPARWFDLQFKLGEIHEKLGEYEKAEKSYNRVAARALSEGFVVEAQYRIGHMWLNAGNPKRALGSFVRLVAFQDPSNDKIRKWIAFSTFEAGVALIRNKEGEKARKYLQDFLREYEEPEYRNYREEAEQLLKELGHE